MICCVMTVPALLFSVSLYWRSISEMTFNENGGHRTSSASAAAPIRSF